MDLVVLAAGMGSRFGGLKQVAPIDEDNNFILDYSVYDAVKAGFDRVVFIIKEENYEYFKSTIGARLSKVIPVEYAFQSLDNVPNGFTVPENRVKPWGTAHALYCCKDVVADKFAVINADDFYGYESFKLIADFLKTDNSGDFINAGFLVTNTLSEKGSVKRGIFTLDNGYASELVESEIEIRDNKVMATPLNENNWREISPNTLVSMNMFGFDKKLMDRIDRDFNEFFNQPTEILEKAEFLLPMEVNRMLQDGEVKLRVDTTTAKWYGITYKEDLDGFKQAIVNMKQTGQYPKHLY